MYAVIMAGGVGTRFWPRSRRRRPKQLLPISSSQTMIRLTVERLKPLLANDRILVVTGAQQEAGVRQELPELPKENIIVEPVGRNTAPCIGLAAAILSARGAADETMAVLAADHVIKDAEGFRQVLKACDQLIASDNQIVTLGIKPHRPETGYGYIRKGTPRAKSEGQEFCKVERFLEKPNAEKAQAFLDDGLHLWNSGMFLWRSSRILQEIDQHLPELTPGLERLAAAWGTSDWDSQLKAEYEAFDSISIDFGVMEKAQEVLVAEVDFGWSDVGSWASLPELRRADSDGNLLSQEALVLDGQRNIVEGHGRQFVLLGVSDLIVVEEEDAILICHRDRAQEVGRIPEALRRLGKESLT